MSSSIQVFELYFSVCGCVCEVGLKGGEILHNFSLSNELTLKMLFYHGNAE